MTSITVILSALAGSVATAGVIFTLNKRKITARYEQEAKSKAKAIVQEAELLLRQNEATVQSRRIELENEYRERLAEVDALKKELIKSRREIENERNRLHQSFEELQKKEARLQELEAQKRTQIDEAVRQMSSLASITPEEAKRYVLEKVEQQSRAEIAAIVRRNEYRAKEEAKQKANYILAQAVSRYAGEFAGERLINVITLPTDEHKGRIIGKEGRNIKTLEMLLGVDIIIDETPGVILVSSFNLYRRAIATEVIRRLVEDGRIHPARIEEIHQKVEEEFEEKTYEEGRRIVIDLGLYPMHEELIRLLGKLKYRASYGQNALAHTLEVARLARVMAAEMGGDEYLAMRAGLLHDIGKALTQEQGGSHVDIGVELCQRYDEHPTVINAILAHHGHAEPDSVESAAVCAADTLSAARPGARREVLEAFLKRVRDIESIALAHEGVDKAYALNAGRELRVFVDAGKIDDAEAFLLSKEIAKEIEKKVQYPGEVKVNLIRQTQAVSMAR